MGLSTQQALFCFKNPAIPTFALVYTIIGSESLTTVFGMGTGDPFRYGHREGVTRAVARRDPCWIGKCQNILTTAIVNCRHRVIVAGFKCKIPMVKRSSISTSKLNTLRCLHI